MDDDVGVADDSRLIFPGIIVAGFELFFRHIGRYNRRRKGVLEMCCPVGLG